MPQSVFVSAVSSSTTVENLTQTQKFQSYQMSVRLTTDVTEPIAWKTRTHALSFVRWVHSFCCCKFQKLYLAVLTYQGLQVIIKIILCSFRYECLYSYLCLLLPHTVTAVSEIWKADRLPLLEFVIASRLSQFFEQIQMKKLMAYKSTFSACGIIIGSASLTLVLPHSIIDNNLFFSFVGAAMHQGWVKVFYKQIETKECSTITTLFLLLVSFGQGVLSLLTSDDKNTFSALAASLLSRECPLAPLWSCHIPLSTTTFLPLVSLLGVSHSLPTITTSDSQANPAWLLGFLEKGLRATKA